MRGKRKHSCSECGNIIRDTNDTGDLCDRCYQREYYPDDEFDY